MKHATFYFDSLEAATETFLTVLIEARVADSVFEFSGQSAEQLFRSGLRLEGEIETLVAKIDKIAGATRYEQQSEEMASGESGSQG